MALLTTREVAGVGCTVQGSPLSNAVIDGNFIALNVDLALKATLVSPTLVQPNLGTPASGTLTHCTGGAATTAATLAVTRAIYGNNFDGSAALTQVIGSAYGGTGNGWAKITGPTTSEKTFTLPDATTTILTTNALVTSAQGGTGNAYTKFTGPTTAEKTFTLPDASATLARTDAAQSFTGIQTITNITFPTNGQILLTVPSIDGHATGHTTNAFNSGYSSSIVGDLVYLDSASKWQKCDANTLALYNGLLGIALEVKADGNALLVALPGSMVYATGFRDFTSFIGSPLYMSESPGVITEVAPTTADAAVRIVGWAIHADKIFFNPSADYVTVV